jgi:BirA family biotin operon repressor/biotin-[acetyl-CoA-carboxylase] ligase
MTDTVANALPDASTGFKWPNDVLVNGRKVCGVLAELLPELLPGQGGVVIGAGINLGMTVEQLPVDTATSLAIEGAGREAIDPDTVLVGYLSRLRELVEAFIVAEGDAEASGLAAQARSRCITLGRAVSVELPDGSVVEGTADALDADGRLIVRHADGGKETVAAGDVTHARIVPPGPVA